MSSPHCVPAALIPALTPGGFGTTSIFRSSPDPQVMSAGSQEMVITPLALGSDVSGVMAATGAVSVTTAVSDAVPVLVPVWLRGFSVTVYVAAAVAVNEHPSAVLGRS